jgi:hypothetical protein
MMILTMASTTLFMQAAIIGFFLAASVDVCSRPSMSFGAAFALLEEVQVLVNCMRISFVG